MPFKMQLDGECSIEETLKVMEYIIQREEKEKQDKKKDQEEKNKQSI